jgi:hypothetical protein
MTYADFQAHWEQEAGAEYDAYVRRSATELVADAPVDLSADRDGQEARLDAVRRMLQERLGGEGTGPA